MFLKRIEIVGFKSFADKTVIDFCAPGSDTYAQNVTAVIGPNGSGKSNIADAIRWAMGEQSSKSLRGKNSRDVIFQGTEKRPSLSHASVTLVFDNSDASVAVPYGEISLTRKVYASGEGEYRLNGSKARLMDVIDLLAKAGIGKESHCVITQGMSDQTLGATPLERRSIIEEASGVKPYKLKRDRAMRKLRLSRENLSQTQVLIDEITPRLRALKRQAKKAQQKQELETQLRGEQEQYFAFLYTRAYEENRKLETEKEQLGRKTIILERKAESLVKERQNLRSKNQDSARESKARQEIHHIRQELSGIDREHAQTETRLEMERERAKEQRTVERVPVDLPFVRKRLSGIQKTCASVRGLLALNPTESSTEETKTQISKKVAEIEQAISSLFDDCAKSTVEVERAKEIIDTEKALYDQKIHEHETKLEKLEDTRNQVKKKIEKLETELREMSRDSQTRNREISELERELYDVERERNSLQEEHSEARVQSARAGVRLENVVAQVRQELGRDAANLPKAPDGFSSIDAEGLLHSISTLKTKLAYIGGIDPGIALEYKEVEERHAFLTGQHADLTEAIASLEKMVEELDKKIEVIFKKTFEEINQEFNRYFVLMFNGGSARLEKVKIPIRTAQSEDGGEADEEGILKIEQEELYETGVEIHVAPPKKKISSLTMLSGGERSLVSLALLFAIISHNPPPFAILDEVEAALDEANSRRFGKLLETLSKKTQFVVVTHNRETMKISNFLYGVTMGSDGVSKLLSVKLDDVKPDKDS